MIVMKFGGTSVADAERIHAVAEIVAARVERRPVVVVSALGGATDLLEQALAAARHDRRDELEPILADLVRRHRWALSGCISDAGRRHDLGLEIDRGFDDLRERLRSIRILREGTPRATDAVLALGERLASSLVAAALVDRGLPAIHIDAEKVMITDDAFGRAQPCMATVKDRCRTHLASELDAARIPVLGGFVGRGTTGETTTLGRGGSDTSAAVLGLAMKAEEIQIWSDVDGLMTADPRLVPTARTLDRITFAEATELAFYGARVLHPASIAPAVEARIPVRVLNSMRPGGSGTLVLGGTETSSNAPAAVVSRDGVCAIRLIRRRPGVEPGFVAQVTARLRELEISCDQLVSGEVGVCLIVPSVVMGKTLAQQMEADAVVEIFEGRAVLSVVGQALASAVVRSQVLGALAEWEPDLVSLGGSSRSVTAVVPEERLQAALRDLHRRFCE